MGLKPGMKGIRSCRGGVAVRCWNRKGGEGRAVDCTSSVLSSSYAITWNVRR